MNKIRPRDTRKLKNLLKAHAYTPEQQQTAWMLLETDSLDAALSYLNAHQQLPQQQASVPCDIWGADQIDSESLDQMQAATNLPIAVRGALMPDAHVGYGLPIGGVLATDGAVIPYAVGVDIACRMRLTVFDAQAHLIQTRHRMLVEVLQRQTRFGVGRVWEPEKRLHHPVLDSSHWQTTPLLRELHELAVEQLGTSGSGNHFVEWGIFTLTAPDAQLGIAQPGSYLALLSHSGSRGVGARIADHYSRLARELHPALPSEQRHLGWLDLASEAGQEYWLSMQLAGEFASANHWFIHERITSASGLQVLATIENHHNFAWMEMVDGVERVVHRKGATPAGAGVLGVIPGSMGDPGYVVRGKGNPASLNSASHGAGRKLSRKKARDSITRQQQIAYLKERGIELLDGGLDEAPQAYKSIQKVMQAQADLVEIVGEFQPRIVQMSRD